MGAVTEVVAHRGSSADVPEHTLAAYEQAVADGADALECDVRLTADGHLVCVHDRRIDRTSDGRGIVSTMTLSDLDGLDFGAWYAEQREARERADADAALRGLEVELWTYDFPLADDLGFFAPDDEDDDG